MTKQEFIKIIEECNATKDIAFVAQKAKEVVATKKPYFICDFAEFVTLSDTPEVMPILEDGMIATDDIVHCYEFAFDMADHDKKFNLKRFEDLIIKHKLGKIEYYFLECVKGCDCLKMFEAFTMCAPSKWLRAFSENEELAYLNKNPEGFEALIVAREGEEERVRTHLTPEERVDIIKQSIYSRKPISINDAAEYTAQTQEEIDALFESMMATDDLLHIYELYCSVPALTDEQKLIILDYLKNNDYLNSAKYMYYVSAYTDLPVAEVEKMLESARKTGNTEYIEKIEKVLQAKQESESE